MTSQNVLNNIRSAERAYDIGMAKVFLGFSEGVGSLLCWENGSWLVKGIGTVVTAVSGCVLYQGNKALSDSMKTIEHILAEPVATK